MMSATETVKCFFFFFVRRGKRGCWSSIWRKKISRKCTLKFKDLCSNKRGLAKLKRAGDQRRPLGAYLEAAAAIDSRTSCPVDSEVLTNIAQSIDRVFSSQLCGFSSEPFSRRRIISINVFTTLKRLGTICSGLVFFFWQQKLTMAGRRSFSLQYSGVGGWGACINPRLHVEIVLAQQYIPQKALLMTGILY